VLGSVIRPASFGWRGSLFQGDQVTEKRQLHPKLALFDSDDPTKQVCSFFALPVFFTDTLMRPQISKGIPASFWKFSFVIIRELLQPKKEGEAFVHHYQFNTTFEWFEDEHGLGDAAVQEWSSAYAVSGLFNITKGKRHNHKEKGTPTVWQYNKAATQKDWLAFVRALSHVMKPEDGSKMRRRGFSKDGAVDAAGVFKLRLAIAVDHFRERVNGTVGPPLPPVNTQRIEKLIAKGYGTRQADGSVAYTYLKPRHPKDGVLVADEF
jgi:hypothetical protein